jgi:hypothetical protein
MERFVQRGFLCLTSNENAGNPLGFPAVVERDLEIVPK